MADIGDIAQQFAEEDLERALAARKRLSAFSSPECYECGDDIPAERQAVGGITTCVDCQSIIEAKARFNR